MATCQVGKVYVDCEGGCGLICAGTQCWAWCEPVSGPVMIPAVMRLRYDDAAEGDDVPPGSATLTMCANGTTRRSLAHVLRTILEQDLVSFVYAADDSVVEPFTGTLDELLTHHGLRRGA